MNNAHESNHNLAPETPADDDPLGAGLTDTRALRKQIQDLKARVLQTERQALIRTFATIQLTSDALIFTGALELPLLSTNDVVLSLEVDARRADGSHQILIEVPVRKLPAVKGDQDVAVRWRAVIDWARFAKPKQLVPGSSFDGTLVVERLDKQVRAEVLVDPARSDAEIIFAKSLPGNLAFLAGSQMGDSLLTVVDCAAQCAEPLQCTVEKVARDGDRLTGSLLVEHPLANADIFALSFGLRGEGAATGEAEVVGEGGIAGNGAGLLPVPLQTAYVARTARRCSFAFSPADIIPDQVPERCVASFAAVLGYAFDKESAPTLVTLDVPVEDGQARAVERHSQVSRDRFIRPRAIEGALRFQVQRVTDALTAPAHRYMAHLGWDEGVLSMRGEIAHPMMNANGFSCHLIVVHTDGERRIVPWELAELPADDCEDDTLRGWSTAFRASRLLSTLKPGNWHFFLEKRFEHLAAFEPFALKRHDGTLGKYVQKIIRTGNDYWLPTESEEGVMGFRTIDAQTVQETATPRIEQMTWRDDVLTVSGTAHHPLAGVGALQCGLMLQNASAEGVDIPVQAAMDKDGSIQWRTEFAPAELLAGKREGMWYLTFAKRFDVQFDSELLINPRGEEAVKRLGAKGLKGGVRLVPGLNDSLGFTVPAAVPVEEVPQAKRRFRFFGR